MKKKVLSVVMAAAMMTSVFSATAVTASAADAENDSLCFTAYGYDRGKSSVPGEDEIPSYGKERSGLCHAFPAKLGRTETGPVPSGL